MLVPGVLTSSEAELLRNKTDDYFNRREEIPARHASYAMNAFVLRNCAELDDAYKSMLTHEPIPTLVEAVLGPQPRFNALNVIRNEPGTAISSWHVDDVVEFPLPDDIPRFGLTWYTHARFLVYGAGCSERHRPPGAWAYAVCPNQSLLGTQTEQPGQSGVRWPQSEGGLLQSWRHLFYQPSGVAPRRTEHVGQNPIRYAAAVRPEMGRFQI